MSITHVDVLLYSFCPNNVYSIPSDWPYLINEVSDPPNTNIPTNYLRLTIEDYNLYVSDPTRVAAYNQVMSVVNMFIGIEANINNAVNQAADFGRKIMLEYGTRNVMAGKSQADIAVIIVRMSKVQQLVLGGALYTALSELDNVEVDGTIIDNTNMTYFKNRIREYLGMTLI